MPDARLASQLDDVAAGAEPCAGRNAGMFWKAYRIKLGKAYSG
jgi:hypothetical protein